VACETIRTFFTFFYVLFKIQKNMTFYVFLSVEHVFSNTDVADVEPVVCK